MEVNPGLPQPPGTTLTLSCVPGFELTGDKEVECREGQEFVFNNQPECSKFIYFLVSLILVHVIRFVFNNQPECSKFIYFLVSLILAHVIR